MIAVIRNSEIINLTEPMLMNNPSEGWHEDGNYVVYIDDLEGLSPRKFILQRYWDGVKFVPREVQPSEFFSWINNSWVLNHDAFMIEYRKERNRLLWETDWTQLSDNTLTEAEKQSIAFYRQQLRDLTAIVTNNINSYKTIKDIPWPTKPDI